MTAYVVARDSSVNTRIRFGNYYQFTCTNGTFNGPTTVSMEKSAAVRHVRLEIADNGRSFHPDHAVEARKNGRLGLASMRERAEMLGGSLEIKAHPGNGTIVKAAVPVNGNHRPHEQKT